MKQENHVEILAPAGSYESFLAAVAAGADAVYLGGSRFGARAFAQNFTEEELLQAIDYAHLHDRKLYLTVNTLLKEKELSEQLYSYLLPLYRQGLDAVIVQDMGVLRFIRAYFPELALHASTQMTVTGRPGAAFLKEAGVERIVPARELSLAEIREMKAKTKLEIECFVHGALCYCYSGQCLLSSLIGGRSGNRGQCAQPCRLPYEYGGRKGYLLSLKDICTLDLIPELIEAGIDSFKIEGRMKKPEYVSGVVSIYKKYTELYYAAGKEKFRVREEDRELLMDLYNRGGFHAGYARTHNGPEMLSAKRPNHAGTPVARVLSQKGRELRIQAVSTLYKGDVLELSGGHENYTLGKDLKTGEKHTILVPKKCTFVNGQLLFRIRCTKLVEELHGQYLNRKIQENIYGFLKLFPEKPATLELSCKNRHIVVSGETVQSAKKHPLDEERIRGQMEKTGNMPFQFERLDIELGQDCFYPMQQLNALRREAAEELEDEILRRHRRVEPKMPANRKVPDETAAETGRDGMGISLSVSVESAEQLEAVLSFGKPGRIYVESSLMTDVRDGAAGDAHTISGSKKSEKFHYLQDLKDAGWEVFLAFPHICRRQAQSRLIQLTESAKPVLDGVLVRNLESIRLLQETGFDKTVITDHNLYVFNREAKAFFAEAGLSEFTAPLELNARELADLGLETAELIIYGYEPVMVSAQCLEYNCKSCTKKPGYHMLTDRHQRKFAVKNECAYCYNVIYNADPLMLFSEADAIQKLHPLAFRLAFTRETRKETEEILAWYGQVFPEKETSGMHSHRLQIPKDRSYTKGHFRRGIK